MKKSGFILTLLAITLTSPAFSQTSTEHLYNTLSGSNVVFCTNYADGNSVVGYQYTSTALPCFFYHKQNATTTKRYQCDEGITVQPIPDSYTISDMEIVGNYCYFCGTYKTGELEGVIGGGYILVITETGYIGRFLLSEIMDDYPMIVEFCKIPGTSAFTKMAPYDDGVNKMVFLIGTADQNHQISCMAAVKENGSSVNYGLYTMPDDSETLTDLDYSSIFVTASKVKNNNFEFCLRAESSVMDILLPNPVSSKYEYLNSFNTSLVNTVPEPRPTNPTKHDNDVRIMLTRDYDGLYVAYDCFGGANDAECLTDYYHTALFLVDDNSYEPNVNDMTVTWGQLLSKDQRENNSLMDLLTPNYQYSILVHRYTHPTTASSGEIQFPSMLSFGPLQSLHTDYRLFTDMGHNWINNTLTLVGVQGASNNIFHFRQDVSNFSSSCYSVSPRADSEEMDLPVHTISHTNLIHTTGQVPWGHSRLIQPEETNYIIDCQTR